MDSLVWVAALVLGGLAPLLVRYTPTQPANAPKHRMRKRLMEMLRDRPMTRKKTMRTHLDCSPNTLDHHLKVLMDGNLVGSRILGGYQRYFLEETDETQAQAIGALRGEQPLRLARKVVEEPGSKQSQLTQDLGMSRKMIRTYLDRLMDAGLILEETIGRAHVYHPTSVLVQILERVEGSSDLPRKKPPPSRSPDS